MDGGGGGKAGGLTGVFQRLLDGGAPAAAAADPADLGTSYGLDLSFAQREVPATAAARPRPLAWLRRRGQTAISRSGS